MMEQAQKNAQGYEITDEQKTAIYSLAPDISKETREEICPAMLDEILECDKGPLKNELGRVIFHLQKNERLDTIIGLEKLIDACLIVCPDAMFKILEGSEADAKELSKKIKAIL